MNKEKIQHLTSEAVLNELSQTELDGRELLDFDQVLNVVISVIKNCDIPDVADRSEQYHCELFDFGRQDKRCSKQCESCEWIEGT